MQKSTRSAKGTGDSALSRRAFGTCALAASLSPALSALGTVLPAGDALADSDPLSVLRDGGHVALMRHAIAPGYSDPQNFRLDDCSTQRNLSAEGREQARRTGAGFRDAGIATARVYSSRWCRCLETARLLDIGPVTPLPLLDSFFEDRDRGPGQTERLRDWIARQPLDGPVVLVTHQVNISALAGIAPRSGETLILRRAADGTLGLADRRPPA